MDLVRIYDISLQQMTKACSDISPELCRPTLQGVLEAWLLHEQARSNTGRRAGMLNGMRVDRGDDQENSGYSIGK
jgi:hypothetical protein